MTYGIFLPGYARPKSKKQIKELVADGKNIMLENTSMFGGYGGNIKDAPDGSYTFVGPDPRIKRKFYGTIVKKGTKITVK